MENLCAPEIPPEISILRVAIDLHIQTRAVALALSSGGGGER